MAVAQNTVIIDDVEYKPGEQLPELGSIHRVFKDGGKRHYEGLAKDSDKLPLYVANNSSCFMTDTGEYYKFDESKKLWYKPDKIDQSKVTPIEVYGVLNGKIQQVSEDVEGIATPLLYKGSVSDISQLPLSPKIGWMYNISEKSIYGEAGMNVAWTGEIWDTLGPAIDMAPYLREDSEIITSLKTKTENLESANYTDRGKLADTDAFLINDGTGKKKSVLSKLSDFVLNKIADKVFTKLQTNDKTILGAINELNSNASQIFTNIPQITTSIEDSPFGFSFISSNANDKPGVNGGFMLRLKLQKNVECNLFLERVYDDKSYKNKIYYRAMLSDGTFSVWSEIQIK